MPPRQKITSRKPFMFIGFAMLLAGFTLMLWPVIAGIRIHAADPRLMTGFITAATGAMMLTRTRIALFFYFLYVISFLVFQIRHNGFFSLPTLGMLLLLGTGILLIKSLKRKRRS